MKKTTSYIWRTDVTSGLSATPISVGVLGDSVAKLWTAPRCIRLQFIISEAISVTMHHPRVPALILLLFVLLRCIAAAPSNRHSSSSSFGEEESALLPDGRESSVPIFPFSNPFLGLMATREVPDENSHLIQKRKCNTATCVTQRLADFLVRSSNTIGTVYAPTNVGSATYGKRELLLPPNYYFPL